MVYQYRTRGVCARAIQVELDGDKVANVEFVGGCDGNLRAIGKLVKGMDVDQVVSILQGNRCGSKSSSCADQLTIALREAQAAQANA